MAERRCEQGGIDMERLTITSDKGGVAFTFDLDINCRPSEAQKILKLAQKLYEYEQAEEQGLLLKLPCKVGDVVYYFSNRPFNLSILPNTIYEADVVRIVTTHLETSIVIRIRNEHGCTEVSQVSSFGKRVFLTKAEAEKALEEMEK